MILHMELAAIFVKVMLNKIKKNYYKSSFYVTSHKIHLTYLHIHIQISPQGFWGFGEIGRAHV